MRLVLVGLVAGLLACACASEPLPLSGSWAGPFTADWLGARRAKGKPIGEMRLTLAGDVIISGTWVWDFGDVGAVSGTVSGTATDESVSLRMQVQDNPPCGINVAGAFTDAAFTGSYSSSGCKASQFGTFSLTRR